MKKSIIMSIMLVLSTLTLSAQKKEAEISPSPLVSLTQDFGTMKIAIEHSRPSVKNRAIFAKNGLVPFGKLWRTGAGDVTKITFSDDIMIEGKTLGKGGYAMLTTPNANSWDIHFYTYKKGSWKSYKTATPDLTVSVSSVAKKDFVESLLITVDNLRNTTATLNIIWENTIVPIQLKTITQ